MASSNLLILRKSSKNSGVVNATEAASTNAIVVPPGEYDVEVTHGANTGSATSYAFNLMESSDGSTFAALVDARSRNADLTKSVDRWFFRGVRITKWAAGAINFGVQIVQTGGTVPTLASVQVTLHPRNMTESYNGQP